MVNRLTKNPTWRAVALKIALLGGGSVVQAGAGAESTPAGRPAEALLRQQIKEILSQAEYQTEYPMWLSKLSGRAIELLVRVLRWIFMNPLMERLYAQWPVLYWLFVAVLAALAILLIYHIFATIGGAFGRRRRKRREPTQEPGPVVTSPTSLRQRARHLAARGDFAGALRALYQSCLRRLERQGYLRYHPWLTNGEYLRAVHSEPQLQQLLMPLTTAVDRVTYGRRPLAATGYQELTAVADQLWQRAGE
ncbi:MAG: DUF4129 domain-containing protein [Armatimonadetes bacterium]|nr:DUF4129 domain-containing protein [Armatimonadota bacterium]